jgi:hypothetical protein
MLSEWLTCEGEEVLMDRQTEAGRLNEAAKHNVSGANRRNREASSRPSGALITTDYIAIVEARRSWRSVSLRLSRGFEHRRKTFRKRCCLSFAGRTD